MFHTHLLLNTYLKCKNERIQDKLKRKGSLKSSEPHSTNCEVPKRQEILRKLGKHRKKNLVENMQFSKLDAGIQERTGKIR